MVTPNFEYDSFLANAGLGYKVIAIDPQATVADLRMTLTNHFSLLRLSPFYFMKTTNVLVNSGGVPILPYNSFHEHSTCMQLFGSRSEIIFLRPMWEIL
ncbi:unnamed protein product [Allacma fusca]|nr:unnamed protein product [Allacma fusca]